MRRLSVWVMLIVGLAACQPPPEPTPSIPVASVLGSDGVDAFEKAVHVRPFRFPRDHGAHSTFRNEWWYLTGNLEDEQGREFGFQVTFFRIGLLAEPVARSSAWGARQLWMAHAALTDIGAQRHWAAERFSRENPGMAGATMEPFQVWLDNWQLSADGVAAAFPWRLQVDSDDFDLALTLTSSKPLVLQGEQGLSRKGDTPGNASYYYSLTRLATSGELVADGRRFSVTGLSWLDREWSSGVLEPGQVGWDWFALQLNTGQELMYYQLRDRAGNAHPSSAGRWVHDDGQSEPIVANDIKLTPLDWWQSDDGRRYPVSWRLQQPLHRRDWTILPLVKDQQMKLSIRYWEGAVEVVDTATGKRLGKGYLEMTGY